MAGGVKKKKKRWQEGYIARVMNTYYKEICSDYIYAYKYMYVYIHTHTYIHTYYTHTHMSYITFTQHLEPSSCSVKNSKLVSIYNMPDTYLVPLGVQAQLQVRSDPCFKEFTVKKLFLCLGICFKHLHYIKTMNICVFSYFHQIS